MSHLHRPEPRSAGPVQSQDEPRSQFADVAGRFANWITGADRLVDEEPDAGRPPEPDPLRTATASSRRDKRELTASSRRDEPAGPLPAPETEEPSRFPLSPFGYNRTAVDQHLTSLERELSELRANHAPAISITDELERIGEQTASILVVAHDKANETTRLAQEQAERCVADAAANAVAITAQAKHRLRELDAETDSVWRERERLLEDLRGVSASLASLADRAQERFPADVEAAGTVGAAGFHAADLERRHGAVAAADPQRTQPFDVSELDEAGAGSWIGHTEAAGDAGTKATGATGATDPEDTADQPQMTADDELPARWERSDPFAT